jgi:RNA polymerase sigma-70 factor, ECF subfamily
MAYDCASSVGAATSPSLNTSVRNVMLVAIPGLRIFAISLCGNLDRADDLVQETLMRALANIHSFEPGTNMSAWLFTILRNQFLSEYRKRRREVEDGSGVHSARLHSLPEQEGHVKMSEFQTALAKLPISHREALILVGALGFSYEEGAKICGFPIGTLKSRVNRARHRLAGLLSIKTADEFGPDWTMRAFLATSDRM